MESFTTIFVIVYLIIIIYVFFRYNYDSKSSQKFEIYREKLEIEPSEAAYLIDKDAKEINLILADICSLVEKKVVQLEVINASEKVEYIFRKTTDEEILNIKSHEMLSYRLFFDNDKTEINLSEFLNEMKSNQEVVDKVDLKIATIKKSIDSELRNMGIIDKKAEKALFKYNKLSISAIMIFFVLSIIGLSNIYLFKFSFVNLLLSIVLYISTREQEEKFTPYGADIVEKTKAFKRYLKEYIITENKPLYMINIIEYNYTMAIALGLAKIGEKEFIQRTYNNTKNKQIFKGSMKDIITIIKNIIMIILILLTLYWSTT